SLLPVHPGTSTTSGASAAPASRTANSPRDVVVRRAWTPSGGVRNGGVLTGETVPNLEADRPRSDRDRLMPYAAGQRKRWSVQVGGSSMRGRHAESRRERRRRARRQARVRRLTASSSAALLAVAG